jgi:hypothetical protein
VFVPFVSPKSAISLMPQMAHEEWHLRGNNEITILRVALITGIFCNSHGS